MRLHTSNPGYDIDDASCPLKNNGILFHKAKINISLVYIKNTYKAKNLSLFMSKRKLFTKFITKVVNTTKQCSLKDMYNIVTYINLSFDLSLVYDFNTVDFQQTAIL